MSIAETPDRVRGSSFRFLLPVRRVPRRCGIEGVCPAAKAAVKHTAETEGRVDGKLRWFHVVCTELLSFFLPGESRGDAAGTAVHDVQGRTGISVGVSHARCVARILRGLGALTEFHGETQSTEMRKLLQRAVHEINEAARAGEPLSAEAVDRIERECGQIIAVAWQEALPPPDGGKRRGKRRKRKGGG